MKPILFNTEMVQTILDGRKTVTRRPIKNTSYNGLGSKNSMELITEKKNLKTPYYHMADKELIECSFKSPYQVGDILYVKETFYQYGEWMDTRIKLSEDEYKTKRFFAPKKKKEIYFFDTIPKDYEILKNFISGRGYYKRPSIFMPREIARIFLEVTDIRVERLQDITKEQAIKEGTVKLTTPNIAGIGRTHIQGFGELWNSTIKKKNLDLYGWDANPWVWVIEFKKIDKEMEETYEIKSL